MRTLPVTFPLPILPASVFSKVVLPAKHPLYLFLLLEGHHNEIFKKQILIAYCVKWRVQQGVGCWQPSHAACLQMHLASWQEKRVRMMMIILRLPVGEMSVG